MGSGISSLSAVIAEDNTSRISSRNEGVYGCEICMAVFSTFKRKHQCCQCTKYFCCSCSLKHRNPTYRGHRCCLRCHAISGDQIDQSRVMLLKAKDLRKFLVTNNIPTRTSQSKLEMVELVISHLQDISNSELGIIRTPLFEDELEGSSSNNNRDTLGTSTISENDLSNQTGNNNTQDTSQSSNLNEDVNKPLPTEEIKNKDIKRRISLSDIRSENDIRLLSVRQLKQILVTNFVDYKGCVEKWELIERVHRLYVSKVDTETKRNIPENKFSQDIGDRKSSNNYDSDLCKICMDAPITCVLLECGHMVTCTKCGKRLAECPICRQYVVRAVHIFKA
ncbi:E3 ubiquitin-protein ligase RNF34 [Trichoplax sp. H2]|nr:E3 ubiquitin-protein ligase RNF34 [Trichoplax sp. H2]|eukprot:RDD47445.1 E3 ubiquitin-protein ligase RNF34 [Trichoplax sp. H2]